MKSLDPRVERLPEIGEVGKVILKPPLDQFHTYEVFVQPKEGKPFQHEGIVHAPNIDLAYILAKETFTRRFTCISLYVVDTKEVFVSPLTEGKQSAYDLIADTAESNTLKEKYEIYHLPKRGKQHVHAGTVLATDVKQAFQIAKKYFNSDKVIYNIWAIPFSTIRFTKEAEEDLWLTLPEKKFRDAADYKGGDRLKEFLEKESKKV